MGLFGRTKTEQRLDLLERRLHLIAQEAGMKFTEGESTWNQMPWNSYLYERLNDARETLDMLLDKFKLQKQGVMKTEPKLIPKKPRA